MRNSIGIGVMGFGVVGGGVIKILTEKAEAISQQVGCPLIIKRILERDPSKKYSAPVAPDLFTTNPELLINDPDIDVIIEVLGGEEPATRFIKAALEQRKHVVTANKEVIAKHGPELFILAERHGVSLFYEAAVGGGIPLIGPFQRDLLANEITSLHAIINGTTNYILTRMAQEGLDFNTALRQAQELGYAEANPADDIDGVDAAYKLAILATLAFHREVRPQDVYHEGISRLAARDFRYAKELGYAIKLLAIARGEGPSLQVRVHPTFIPEDHLLAKVDGVFNAVQVGGDLIGRMIFYGRGAGSLPTTSAIIADVIDLARSINLGVATRPRLQLDAPKSIKPISQITTRYYLRMSVADRPGVLAQIARVLGDNFISIASVIQKEADEKEGTAEIVIMTHPAPEAAMQQALSEVERLAVVREIGNFVRVED